MRKQELVHLHMLIAALRRDIAEREPVPSAAYAEYEAHGVTPTAVHHKKEAHKTSVQLLLTGIVSTIHPPAVAEPAT
ncbi:UPF0058 family protein [Halovivax gelatinilyticus]|uniref:UPF0058 family protein n=1 Tax=Halovivax gelatinilyticus TaxID=2961597 RepID=UPI0020CA612B|nr:UPF0058 family protein [Halovivax gelatinilyticus]